MPATGETSTREKRRCHLVMSGRLWQALVLKARSLGVSVSSVVERTLAERFEMGLESAVPDPVIMAVEGDTNVRRHQVSIDGALWNHFRIEAARRGVSVAAVIRERLRSAVLTPAKSDGGVDAVEKPVLREPWIDEIRNIEVSKSVRVFDF